MVSSVNSIASGGERFDASTVERIHPAQDLKPHQRQGREGGSDPASAAAAMVDIGVLTRLQMGKGDANDAAIAVREADRTYSRMEGMLRDSLKSLTAITKQFPPFLSDDPQRLAYLKNFSGLRAQIDALMVPPDARWSVMQLGEVRVPGYKPDLPGLDGASATDGDVVKAARATERSLQDVVAIRSDLAKQILSRG